jgi:hypothetical protein
MIAELLRGEGFPVYTRASAHAASLLAPLPDAMRIRPHLAKWLVDAGFGFDDI